jgi:hypothetical protein
MHVFQVVCRGVCISIKALHPSPPPKLEGTKTFTRCPNLKTLPLQLLDLLRFCWNNDMFLPTPSLQSWLLHTNDWSKQISMIVSSNAHNIKSGMKISNSLECTLGQ